MLARPMRRALSIALSVAAGLLAAPIARAETGPYLDIAGWQRIEDSAPIGPEGVPQARYPWGVEDNPVTVEQWALQHWSYWTQSGAQADLDAAVRGADWLLAHQQSDGTWVYTFDWSGAGEQMRAPWISAMAQGQAMSLLVRVYDHTGDRRYLDAATAALAPFATDVAHGGVVADFDGDPWYEEYPTPPLHVLNGFEFTLVGLHDLAPYDADARPLFDAGVASLIHHVGDFDDPPSRGELYGALGASRILVTGSYPHIHAMLTLYLAGLSGSQTLLDYGTRWKGYLTPLPSPPAPAVAPTAAPRRAVVVERPAWTCTLAGHRLSRHGHVACHRARHVLRRFLSGRRVLSRAWRCGGRRIVTCRRHADWVRVRRFRLGRERTQAPVRRIQKALAVAPSRHVGASRAIASGRSRHRAYVAARTS